MLNILRLAKRYPNGHLALSGFDLDVAAGEIVAVVGGSGCGKSTLLRLIAGLDRASGGNVSLNGKSVIAPHPEIGLVFQEPRLMPWLTIRENVGFGLRDLRKEAKHARVVEALSRVGLADVGDHWPRELSGGMAQRVSLVRALVARPSVLLLDEPFSALDALTRYDLQEHLVELWSFDRPTLVLVTHDIEEALFLADRVVVMRGQPGRIHSISAPHLPRPRNRGDQQFQSWKQSLFAELHDSVRAAPVDRTGEIDENAGIVHFKKAV
ncbi:MAG TPA: ABC transporter ATP-binding protein [Alphaproteobacteria bacterium]|nr:ABC transporter ATP-binding protein [Alphaproteobacteria bacterium]